MGDPGVPQDPQQIGRRIGLHRIERAARKLLDEETGGAPRGMRTQQRDRLNRSQLDDVGSAAAAVQGRQLAPARYDACATQGTSNGLVRQSCLAVGSPMGQRSAIYVRGSAHARFFGPCGRFWGALVVKLQRLIERIPEIKALRLPPQAYALRERAGRSSMSASVVAHEQTLTRMTERLRHFAPPTQHSPDCCILAIVASVRASLSHPTRTWLNTTSLRISKP